MALKDELREFGLDDKKARIYLALLELGQAKAHQIALKAKVARPTVYDLLEKLVEDGLVGAYEKHKVRYYIANDPEKIKRNLNDKLLAFGSLLPELKSIYNTLQTKPKISFFEGIEGVKTVLEDVIMAKEKQIRGILSMHDLFKMPGKQFMDDYVARRVKLGYFLQVIRSKIKDVPETWPTNPGELRQLRYAPAPMVFEMTTYIYDNKVGLISTARENFGMIIESPEYSQTMGYLFEALWQVSGPA
jgi:sugar-specific transcriptional regulator TrmB